MLHVELEGTDFGLDLAVRLDVNPGELLALAGPSGVGKTTVLRAVAGLLRPRRGRVICGKALWLDTAARVELAPEARRCGFVFQDYALFDHMTPVRNVAYAMRGVARSRRRRRALELLRRFGVEERAEARIRDLSGGERQRVALARAIANEPHALLLDEPLAALDTRTRAAAMRQIELLVRSAGVPAVIVTHDFTEAATLADQVGVIDGGRIVQRGTPSELAAQPRSAFVANFVGSIVLTGAARRGSAGLTEVALDGGGVAVSTDEASGPVAISMHPWEITIERDRASEGTSARNHLSAQVTSLTTLGNRVRVGLVASQPLVAEVTDAAVTGLRLRVGERVYASWKASATRVVER